MIKIIQDYEFRTEDESYGNVLWLRLVHASNHDWEAVFKHTWLLANEYDSVCDLAENHFAQEKEHYLYRDIGVEDYLNRVELVIQRINNYEGILFSPQGVKLDIALFEPLEKDRLVLMEDGHDSYSVFIYGETESKFFSWVDPA